MFWKRKKREPPSIILVQGSLHPRGLTDILVDEASRILARYPVSVEVIDVRKRDIDYYDTRSSKDSSKPAEQILARLERAVGCIISMPVYSVAVAGAVKDFLAFAGATLDGKPIGVMCVGKKEMNYTASVKLLSILSTQARARVVKPVLLASQESFHNGRLFDEQVHAVIGEMIDALITAIHTRDANP